MKPDDLVAGRFRIERAIGSGGRGVVYRARDEQTGKLAAVKVGFSIALSAAQPEIGQAAESSTALLTRSVMASVFGGMPGNAIAVDPATVKSLEPAFEIERSGSLPQLVGEKAT